MNMNKLLIIGALVTPGLVFADCQVNQVSMVTISDILVKLSIEDGAKVTTGTPLKKLKISATPRTIGFLIRSNLQWAMMELVAVAATH